MAIAPNRDDRRNREETSRETEKKRAVASRRLGFGKWELAGTEMEPDTEEQKKKRAVEIEYQTKKKEKQKRNRQTEKKLVK